ncbi:hypothetical protein [Erythrobacter sp. THAF29]|uniref:hypothetical protein n=1 Tax=Erythrobacter sp. THAF29 TaxID=2587851 RepID=UPI0012678F27|nr:hypothetical protein [Erythrobacter sp. THAF29]QFT78223.1 hypothetical protein FIU90_11800 [Erythrobacter sp. THAF29]
MLFARPIFAVSLVGSLAACDAPDPDDYGGGAVGDEIVQCIKHVEAAHQRYTREHSEPLCVCVVDDLGLTTGNIFTEGKLDRSKVGRHMENCVRARARAMGVNM